jgi:hypothetical protein
MYFSPHSFMLHVHPLHTPWFKHLNSSKWRIQIINLPIV